MSKKKPHYDPVQVALIVGLSASIGAIVLIVALGIYFYSSVVQ